MNSSPFGVVIGGAKLPVFEEQVESRPVLQDVVERHGQVVATSQFADVLLDLGVQILDHGTAQRARYLSTVLRTIYMND